MGKVDPPLGPHNRLGVATSRKAVPHVAFTQAQNFTYVERERVKEGKEPGGKKEREEESGRREAGGRERGEGEGKGRFQEREEGRRGEELKIGGGERGGRGEGLENKCD